MAFSHTPPRALGARQLRIYATFVALLIGLAAGTAVLLWLAGLPGRIAIARKHPDAEAVKLLGWAGFLPVVPWIQAFVWAFKPTEVVDARRFPLQGKPGGPFVRNAPGVRSLRGVDEISSTRERHFSGLYSSQYLGWRGWSP